MWWFCWDGQADPTGWTGTGKRCLLTQLSFRVCRAGRAPATNLLVRALRYLTPGVASGANVCVQPTSRRRRKRWIFGRAGAPSSSPAADRGRSRPGRPHISGEDESLIWKSYGRRNESPDRHRAAHRNLQVSSLPARAHPVGHHGLQQRPGQPLRVPRLLRLCAPPHPAVPVGAPGVLQLPAQADLLPHLPGPPGLHQEPGHGEGGQLGAVPLQVRLLGLRGDAAAHGEDGARGAVRVPALLLPLPGGLLQVAGLAGRRHAPPDAPAQVHHHAAGRGHRLPGHGHQPAGRGGLGDDAVLLRLPLHAGAGEAGEVRRPPAVLRHRAAHRHAQAGRELCLPAGAERPPAPADLGGHAALHPRRHRHRHHEQRLPGLRHLHRAALRRERQPGHQRHHLHVLRTPPSRALGT